MEYIFFLKKSWSGGMINSILKSDFETLEKPGQAPNCALQKSNPP